MTSKMKEAHMLAKPCTNAPFIGKAGNVECYIIREYMNGKNNERVTWYYEGKRVSKSKMEEITK